MPNRRRIFEAIVRRPGTHVRRLSRDLELALGSVEHHLRQLEKHGLVFSHHGGRRRSYYAADGVDPRDAEVLHALRNPTWADILSALVLGEEAGVAGVAERVGLSPATASYHLRRMRDRGLLEHCRVGRESVYLVCDPDRVLRLCASALEGPGDGEVAPDACFHALVARARRGDDGARPAPRVRVAREDAAVPTVR